jgi:hypothetical protein
MEDCGCSSCKKASSVSYKHQQVKHSDYVFCAVMMFLAYLLVVMNR